MAAADENAPSAHNVLGHSKIFTPEVIDDIHVKAELGRYRILSSTAGISADTSVVKSCSNRGSWSKI